MPVRRVPELRFELDVEAQPPAMVSSALGIGRVTHRSPEALHRDITVFDAVDERLLRAGIVVAHRMASGAGQWYLAAPTWQPRIPAETVEPHSGSVGLPQAFLDMIRPVARRAQLSPVATLDCDTKEYVLRSGDGTQLGVITDQRVTVRRGESSNSRYREVTVMPGAAMTSQQSAYIIEAMQGVGASKVERFPTLQQRLGPPATGLTDFPAPQPLRRDASMEELTSAVFAADLRAITELLLDAVRDERPHVAPLNAQLETVRRDLAGLAHALEPSWREDVENLLAGLPYQELPDAVNVALDVSEALVRAVRAPKLGHVGLDEATPLLLQRAQQAALIMSDRCSELTLASPDRGWKAAWGAAEALAVSAAVAQPVLGKSLRRSARRLQGVTEHLRACNGDWTASESDLAGLTVEEAFTLGRQMERGRVAMASERGRFVALWPERLDELRRLLLKEKRSR